MKKLLLILLAITVQSVFAQHVSKTIEFGGVNRQYLEYVPAIYDDSEAVPLVICLHGLGDNMNNFSGIQMNRVADTANFIILTPQALNSMLGTAWNSGASMYGMQLNDDIDDVGFIGALIDYASETYNIDLQRVYATGFSLGGFMSNRLACEYAHRITAIASVAGTIGSALDCIPSRAIPVMHFHGTADETIGYETNQYGMGVEDMLNFWVENNQCDETAIITDFPDIANDGFTAEHHLFDNGTAGTVVEHVKIFGADHDWLYTPVNDIDYTTLIWEFFSKHKFVGAYIDKAENIGFEVYPNPASDLLNISCEEDGIMEIYSLDGKIILSEKIKAGTNTISAQDLKSGSYLLKYTNGKQQRTMVVNKK